MMEAIADLHQRWVAGITVEPDPRYSGDPDGQYQENAETVSAPPGDRAHLWEGIAAIIGSMGQPR